MFKKIKNQYMNLEDSDLDDNIPLNINKKEKESQSPQPLPPKDETIKMIYINDNFAYKLNHLKKSLLMPNKMADE